MTPSPDPEVFAAEYAASRARIRQVIEDAGGDAAARRMIPACPEWNIVNVCSHLAGIASDLVARRNPGPDAQAWVDGQIAERRNRTVASVLDEWDEVGPAFEALIVKVPRAFAGLLLDVIAHEHDIRHALRRPGGRDAPGVRAAMFTEAELLNRDLTAQGLPAVRVAANGDEWVCGVGDPGLVLDLGNDPAATWELTRLLGSRRSLAQMATYPWQGDWERFLPALAHMSLPDHDLVE